MTIEEHLLQIADAGLALGDVHFEVRFIRVFWTPYREIGTGILLV